MEISMLVKFQILKNQNGKFIPMSNTEAKCVSIGGFSFDIGENSIPFDWDAFYGSEEDKVFYFKTGKGLFFDDYEISECYDEEYEEIGVKREEITAEFLASVDHIEEFFVGFDDNDGHGHDVGWFADNMDDAQYKINIMEMAFLDLATKNEYLVSKQVIDKYNKGE